MPVNFEVFRKMLHLRRSATQGEWVNDGQLISNDVGSYVASFANAEDADFASYVASNAEVMCEEIEKMKTLVDAIEEAALKDDFSPLVQVLRTLSGGAFKLIYPRSDDQESPWGNKRLFLGGAINNGEAEDWQARVIERLRNRAVTVYNPRRENWDPNLRQDIEEPEFAYQVNWELDNIEAADIIFFHFTADGPAPITLMELGSMVGSNKKVIVSCPDGYWRRGNVQVFCRRNNIPLHDHLNDALEMLFRMI